MNKVSMRIDYLLEHHALEDQVRLAAEAGIDALENGEMKGFDCKRAAQLAEANGIRFVACGFYDIWNARIGAPYEEIKDNLARTIECAKELGCNKLLSLTINSESRGPEAQAEFLENLKPVIEDCEKNDMILVLEPHNTKHVNPLFDFSKYFLDTSALAYTLMDKIDSDCVKLLFDCFHIQTMEGDLIQNLRQNIGRITHFHIAGTPERDEPVNGELNYVNIVRAANALGYNEYYGMEYFPTDENDYAKMAEMIKLIKEA